MFRGNRSGRSVFGTFFSFCVAASLSRLLTRGKIGLSPRGIMLPLVILGTILLASSSSLAVQRFSAVLTGAQENPPNGSTARGYGYVVLDDAQTSITLYVGFTGLSANATLSHIHTGAAGANGPVTFDFTGVLPNATSGTITAQTFAINPTQLANLQAGNMYFNIHNSAFPGGEIRGQIGGPTCSTAGPIEVESTGGTTLGTPTAYATLQAAFDAINLGVLHTQSINVEVCGNTTETASAILNSGSVVPASYTSVNVYPVGGARTITGNIVGAVVKLNGADNVTIDGRLSGSSTRDLTISNSSTVAATAAVWLSSVAAGNGASNNVIRNLELAGGVTQNTAILATFGIIMNGATIAVATDGNDNDNNQFIANRIIRVRYGIVTRGVATNLNLNPTVTDNIVGPTAFGADEIGKNGILMQADSGAVVSRNTVQFVGGDFANTTGGADRVGIALGVQDWASAPTTLAGSGYTVTRNVIHDIIEERTFSAVGILVSTTNGTSATNNLVANNFVYNVNANGTAGDAAVGIGIGAGNGDRIVFNSVRMAGDSDPNAGATVPTQIPVNLRVANTPTNLTIRNNSLYNDLSSSSAPTLQSANIQLPSATFAFGTGGLNNNNYFFPVANTTARTGAIGTTSLPTTFFQTIANWQAALTPPQDANSIQADPQYVSATDLHIAAGSPNVNAGATGTGITNDIDFQIRDAQPDIGADEPNGVAGPANDVAAISIVSQVPGSTIPTGTAITPQARFYNAGSATQNGVSVQFTITGPGGYNYSNTQVINGLASDNFVTVTFAAAPTPTTAGSYTMTATVLTPDANASNDSVGGSFNAIDPISGTVTVGTGGTFPSLSNSGGLFEALNLAGVSGNVTVDITTDLTGETGAVVLNQLPGGFGLTIKPSGAARTISGNAASLSMIKLNGADNITIDGSLSGGTDRSLTLLYTNAGGTVIWIASLTGNGASNNTVKNCIIASNPATSSVAGILAGSGATLGGQAEAQNNNITIQNNEIFRVQNGIFHRGALALDQNWSITGNRFGSDTVADKNSFRGMLTGDSQNFVVSNNVVRGVSSTTATTAAMTGIQLAFAVSGGTVTRNVISDIRNNSATGTGAFGMQLSAAPATNITIANNFISDAITLGSATIVNNGHGININAAAPAGAYKIYFNSINMNTNQTTGTTSALNLTVAVVAAGAVDLRNNILANTQTAGATRFAVFSAAAANVFSPINFNDYFAPSVGFIGGSARATLADWQTATGQDANSKAVDPLFVSSTDLHLQPTSTLLGQGVDGTGVTTDIDGQTRDNPPDIGADEIPGVASFGTISGRVTTAQGRGIQKAWVIVSGGGLSQPLAYLTGSFGYFAFPDLPTGATYTVTVSAKRYVFAPPSQQVTLQAGVNNVDFVAAP